MGLNLAKMGLSFEAPAHPFHPGAPNGDKRAYGNGGEEWNNMGIDLRDGMPHLLDLNIWL